MGATAAGDRAPEFFFRCNRPAWPLRKREPRICCGPLEGTHARHPSINEEAVTDRWAESGPQ